LVRWRPNSGWKEKREAGDEERMGEDEDKEKNWREIRKKEGQMVCDGRRSPGERRSSDTRMGRDDGAQARLRPVTIVPWDYRVTAG
jgi:hypothetical protein